MLSAAAILLDLRHAFPHNRIPDETLRLYADRLDDIPVDVLAQATSRLMDTADHFPTMKAIREVAAELMVRLPSEEEALGQIEDRLAWARVEEHLRGERPPLDETVKKALDHVGGFYAFKSADEPGVVRGQFLRLYRDLRSERVREIQIRAVSPAAIQAPPMRAVS